jgi:hypothetical protein
MCKNYFMCFKGVCNFMSHEESIYVDSVWKESDDAGIWLSYILNSEGAELGEYIEKLAIRCYTPGYGRVLVWL